MSADIVTAGDLTLLVGETGTEVSVLSVYMYLSVCLYRYRPASLKVHYSESPMCTGV